jgi:hypothetical protein
MPKKMPLRKTLPKDFEEQLERARTTGDYVAIHAVFDLCQIDARGGVSKRTALSLRGCTPELARWLVARGADVNACDSYGRSALHESSFARFHHYLPPAVLLDLGADIHQTSNAGLTPLHCAADGQNLASVEVLLARGAKVDALAAEEMTPLEYALQRLSNISLEPMVPVAKALLAAGARRTKRAQSFVKRAAETFEFHRAGFNPQSVEEVAAAARALCHLFDVEPPATRKMYDGTSGIVTTGSTLKQKYAELWELLVPSSGPCSTVQGEVIRITGKVADELNRNGGVNWSADHKAMLSAFCLHISSQHCLSDAQIAECKKLAAKGRNIESHTDRLVELAVAWVELNPNPVPLKAPTYSR